MRELKLAVYFPQRMGPVGGVGLRGPSIFQPTPHPVKDRVLRLDRPAASPSHIFLNLNRSLPRGPRLRQMDDASGRRPRIL
jgi:hypothetical protein